MSKQWPDVFNFFFLHPEHSAAERSAEPFMQAGSEIVAMQVRNFVIKMSERMGCIANYFQSMLVSHVCNFSHRHYLPGKIDNMTNENSFCPGSDRIFIP